MPGARLAKEPHSHLFSRWTCVSQQLAIVSRQSLVLDNEISPCIATINRRLIFQLYNNGAFGSLANDIEDRLGTPGVSLQE